MHVFLTGGTGFIGGKLAEKLRGRGDTVVAAVRDHAKASQLQAIGCKVVLVDLNDRSATIDVMRNCETVYHLAGRFEIGIPRSERDAMMRTNVAMTESVIDAAQSASVKRIVYASTINAFGDTRGAIVSETFRRQEPKYLSLYDESKYLGHVAALAKAKQGAPVVIVQPGVVYGAGDHFEIGREILLAAQGKLRFLMLGQVGLTMCFVDDIANGFVAANDKGRIGECYVLGGEITRLSDVLEQAARIGGHQFKHVNVPTALLKVISPFGPSIAPKLGYPPNLKELIRVSDRVTYWADCGKAERELGYVHRRLEVGLKDTLESAGLLTQ